MNCWWKIKIKRQNFIILPSKKYIYNSTANNPKCFIQRGTFFFSWTQGWVFNLPGLFCSWIGNKSCCHTVTRLCLWQQVRGFGYRLMIFLGSRFMCRQRPRASEWEQPGDKWHTCCVAEMEKSFCHVRLSYHPLSCPPIIPQCHVGDWAGTWRVRMIWRPVPAMCFCSSTVLLFDQFDFFHPSLPPDNTFHCSDCISCMWAKWPLLWSGKTNCNELLTSARHSFLQHRGILLHPVPSDTFLCPAWVSQAFSYCRVVTCIHRNQKPAVTVSTLFQRIYSFCKTEQWSSSTNH